MQPLACFIVSILIIHTLTQFQFDKNPKSELVALYVLVGMTSPVSCIEILNKTHFMLLLRKTNFFFTRKLFSQAIKSSRSYWYSNLQPPDCHFVFCWPRPIGPWVPCSCWTKILKLRGGYSCDNTLDDLRQTIPDNRGIKNNKPHTRFI